MSHPNFHGHGYHYPQQFYSNYPTGYFNSRLALSTGFFGAIVGFTMTMGNNIHKVQSQQMSWLEATVDSVVKGGMAGVATFAGSSVAQLTGSRGLIPLILMAATATGVGYLISYVGKPKSSTKEHCEGENK